MMNCAEHVFGVGSENGQIGDRLTYFETGHSRADFIHQADHVIAGGERGRFLQTIVNSLAHHRVGKGGACG